MSLTGTSLNKMGKNRHNLSVTSMINQWMVTSRDLKAFTWDALVSVPMPITLNGYLHRNTVKPNRKCEYSVL